MNPANLLIMCFERLAGEIIKFHIDISAGKPAFWIRSKSAGIGFFQGKPYCWYLNEPVELGGVGVSA